MDEIGMFTALRPPREPLDVTGARDRLAATVTGPPRRRVRARRMRGRAVLSAGVAVVAAAVTTVTLTTGSAPPALATVTTALAHTLTQSYHLTYQGSWYSLENGRIISTRTETCVGEVDPVRHLEARTCRPADGRSYRRVGGYFYYYALPPVQGKHWLRYRILIGAGASDTVDPRIAFASTPQQMLSELKKADKVTVAGPASGPGWTGTRYAFSGKLPISGTLEVDQQGRARAFVMTIRFTSATVWTQVLKFSDFGTRVTVTPPPADQTFSEPTQLGLPG